MTFGYKTAWFAIRTSDTEAASRALGLTQLRSTPAEAGIAAGYGGHGQVFITPAIDGWTLAMSRDFLDLADGVPPAFVDRLPRLSTELGTEVQFFASHRVVEAHAWARARHGALIRAYTYNGSNGEVQIDQGEPTPQEIALGHRFFNPSAPEAADDAYWQRDDLRYADEEDVMQVAGAWSINPQSLETLQVGFLADSDALATRVPAGGTEHMAGKAKASAADQQDPASMPTRRPWWRFW